ncbi:MAG: cupin domain-containing protein [Alphaproteobacteria bacterium]|nr:cupin domain-containing protein [Alphaproteobacteria bacterium]
MFNPTTAWPSSMTSYSTPSHLRNPSSGMCFPSSFAPIGALSKPAGQPPSTDYRLTQLTRTWQNRLQHEQAGESAMTATDIVTHTDTKALIEFSVEKRVRKKLIRGKTIMSDVTCFEPGQEGVAHSHPNRDEIFFVLEGSGSMVVEDEAIPVSQGSIMLIPAGTQQTYGAGGQQLPLRCHVHQGRRNQRTAAVSINALRRHHEHIRGHIDAGQHVQEGLGPVGDVMATKIGIHGPPACLALVEWHMQGALQRFASTLHIVRINDYGISHLARRAREARQH